MPENERFKEQYAEWKAPNESSSEKSEKQRRWEQVAAEVEGTADGLGLEIDAGIRESVIAFKVYEFPTSQSCEGHLEGDRGLPYPWVEVYAPEPEGFDGSEEKRQEYLEANQREHDKMQELLNEFYKGRTAPAEAQLVFNPIGIFGAFRLQSKGAETIQQLSPEEQAVQYKIYKQEMDDFTTFLKAKYFKD